MHEKVFDAVPFFLLRIPTWPTNKFECLHLDKKAPLEIYSENELLREAIAIASPSLYDSLKKRDPKKLDQEAKSLSHYISRMKIRPTPFGLFSSVSTAKWGEATTHIEFNEQLLQKRTRLDMEWVFLLIQKLFQDEKKFLSLPVRTNPLLQFGGERYYLDYLRHTGDAESISTTKSIRATKLIQLILDYAKESISVEQLWLKLEANFPILEQDKALDVIRQLVSQQFLWPGLIPSLLSESSSYETLLSHFPDLDSIFEEINYYDGLPPGKGEKALEKLQNNMGAIVSSKSYLQVDTAYSGKNLELSKIVLEELQQALNLLWKIASVQNLPNILTTYHSKFLKKYDVYRTVPLLELLDEERGLGSLFEDSNVPSFDNEWEKWVKQQWQDCLFHKKKEWVLTEESISSFLESKQHIDPIEAPLSLDVLCKVFADSNQNLDSGNFLLALSYISKEGGSIFGRFLDLLGSDAKNHVAQLFDLEERLENQSLFVELSYLPSAVRNANLAIHPCLRSYRLDIESILKPKGTLALEDIYVGVTTSKFFLTDKESRFNIIPRANHVFNVFYDPLPFKFMRHVAHSQCPTISSVLWGSLQEAAVFLPRIRYGKTILSPATWNVDSQLYVKGSLEKNISSFNFWADQWELPQSFFLVHGDQQLLFDRTNPENVNEIVRKLKRGESLKFIEKIDGAWIKGFSGNHICEITVPFVKNIKYARKDNHIQAAPYSPETNEKRHHFPGGNWLYLKLYLGGDKINEFLMGCLYNFLESFCQEGLIEEWFFVRYYDPDPHLRLRIHSQSFEMISKVLSDFEEQFRLWTQLGWIKEVSIVKYEREIERYGGPLLIQGAETVFYCDSLATLFTIHASLTQQTQCDEMVLYALSVVNFLRSFHLNLNQMLLLLNKLKADEKELSGFRQHKIQLISLINALQEGDSQIPEIQVMNTAFDIRRESVQNYWRLAAHLEKERRDSIILSLLHMHCNRLGCLGKDETKAKLYARQALLSILSKGTANLDLSINQALLK